MAPACSNAKGARCHASRRAELPPEIVENAPGTPEGGWGNVKVLEFAVHCGKPCFLGSCLSALDFECIYAYRRPEY